MLVLDPARAQPVAWRNGAGRTRELWTHPHARVSLADITADVSFSTFPGVDRVFVPLAGGFDLVVGDHTIRTRSGSPVAFPGEATVRVRGLVAPTRALNVMTTRGHGRSHVVLVPTGADPAPGTQLVVRLGRYDAHVTFTDPPGTARPSEEPHA